MFKKNELTDFDINDYLKSKKDIQMLLDMVAEDNDPEFFLFVINKLAKKQGMSKVAKDANLTREGLYRALSENGNPSFFNIYKVLRSLGFSLSVKPFV